MKIDFDADMAIKNKFICDVSYMGKFLLTLKFFPVLSQNATKVKHGTSGECCLSLCQAVSFLPTAEDDEEMMMKREEKQNGGKDILLTAHGNKCNAFAFIYAPS